MPEVEFSLDPGVGEEHVSQRHRRLRKTRQNANSDHERYAVADAALGDLLAQPHQEHRPRSQHQQGLETVKPNVRILVEHQPLRRVPLREKLLRVLPANCHHHALPQAEKHGQITAILNNLGATALFARQFAQCGNDCCEQLNNNSRADIGHDTQGADRAMLQSAAGEQTVHPKHPAARGRASLAVEIIRQHGAIQTWNAHHGLQAADRQYQQSEQQPGFEFRNLEAIAEGVVDGRKHGRIRFRSPNPEQLG